MQVKRLISERIRKNARGINFAADVNAEISVNIAEGRKPRSTSTDRPGSDPEGGARRTERAKEEQ